MSKSDVVVHSCAITLSCVLCYLLYHHFVLADVRPPYLSGTATDLVGKHMSLPGMHWESFPANVVLFVSSSCHYCARSVPFYKKLSRAGREPPSHFSLSVMSIEPPRVIKHYLAAEHLAVDGVYPVPKGVTGLDSTPTLLVVDANGTVRHVFVGLLDSAQQQQVEHLIKAVEPVAGT